MENTYFRNKLLQNSSLYLNCLNKLKGVEELINTLEQLIRIVRRKKNMNNARSTKRPSFLLNVLIQRSTADTHTLV